MFIFVFLILLKLFKRVKMVLINKDKEGRRGEDN